MYFVIGNYMLIKLIFKRKLPIFYAIFLIVDTVAQQWSWKRRRKREEKAEATIIIPEFYEFQENCI